jgi:FtsZ-binding cell division protein ZapB
VIRSNVESTSTTSGALQVVGGAGIGGNIFVGGNAVIRSGAVSTSTSTGALQVIGGVGISGNLCVGGNVLITSTTTSDDTSSGALIVSGHVRCQQKLYIGSNNPAGGGGDTAYLEYVNTSIAGTSDQTVLRLVTMNDTIGSASDNINLNPSGGVGIGKDNPAYKLDISGNLNIAGGNSNANFEGLTITTTANTLDNVGQQINFKCYRSAVTTTVPQASIQTIRENTLSNYSSSLGFSTYTTAETLTEKMRIKANGYVGINTTNPLYLLDISGDLRVGKDNNIWLGNENAFPSNKGKIFFCGNNNGNAYISSGPADGANADSYNLKIASWFGIGFAQLDTPGPAKIYFDTRLGKITATSADISGGPLNVTYPQYTTNSYPKSGCMLVDMSSSGLGGSLVIRNSSSRTTGKAASLAFNLSASSDTFNTDGLNNSNAEIRAYNEGIGTNATSLIFNQYNGTAQVETMKMLYNGNVGIGTSTPSNKLDVNGTVYIGDQFTNVLFSRPTDNSRYRIRMQTYYKGGGANDVSSPTGTLEIHPFGGTVLLHTSVDVLFNNPAKQYPSTFSSNVLITNDIYNFGNVSIGTTNATSSSSPTTGALTVTGGVGITGNLNAGKTTIGADGVKKLKIIGSISGTTLTVSDIYHEVCNIIQIGSSITGGSITNGTTIVSQLTGPSGGLGNYQLSVSNTNATPVTYTLDPNVDGFNGLYIVGGNNGGSQLRITCNGTGYAWYSTLQAYNIDNNNYPKSVLSYGSLCLNPHGGRVTIGKYTNASTSNYKLDVDGSMNLNGFLNINGTGKKIITSQDANGGIIISGLGYSGNTDALKPASGDFGLGIALNTGGLAEIDLIAIHNNNTGGFKFYDCNTNSTDNPTKTLLATLNSNDGLLVPYQITGASFNASSDYRIKLNVQSLMDKTIDDLNPIEYDLSGGRHDMGFLAHEVQEIFPFLVNGEKDGKEFQAINYNGFIALLVKEVQDLKKETKDLKKETKDLKKETKDLKKENQMLRDKNSDFENRLKIIENMLLK